MKLKNKKTGEIIDIYKGEITIHYDQGRKTIHFKHLEDLDDWEDYEEPEEYYCIDWTKPGVFNTHYENEMDKFNKSIGNYFDTKEEAEKAVEKLKAWKRLKDKGFRFDGWDENHHNLGIIEFSFDKVENNIWDFEKDLDLLFGGKE